MTNAEVFAEHLVYFYERAKKYERRIYWKLLDLEMENLYPGKFECDYRYAGVEGPEIVSTDEVIKCLCDLGKTELVAWILQDLHEHGIDFDTEEEL